MAEILSEKSARCAKLAEYVERHLVSRWRWGEVDCVFFAINWVVAATGIDPAKRLRHSYSDEEEARHVISREGGFLTMVAREMAQHGFLEEAEPQDGDIGIVMAPVKSEGDLDMVMAIRSGGRWVTKTMRGLRARKFETVRAWKV